ncbi:ZGRF1-like protein, partial [Mya arenaria]
MYRSVGGAGEGHEPPGPNMFGSSQQPHNCSSGGLLPAVLVPGSLHYPINFHGQYRPHLPTRNSQLGQTPFVPDNICSPVKYRMGVHSEVLNSVHSVAGNLDNFGTDVVHKEATIYSGMQLFRNRFLEKSIHDSSIDRVQPRSDGPFNLPSEIDRLETKQHWNWSQSNPELVENKRNNLSGSETDKALINGSKTKVNSKFLNSEISQNLEDSLKSSSKWQKFAQSQSSDECDVSLYELSHKQKTVKTKRDFTVIDKPEGLFNTKIKREIDKSITETGSRDNFYKGHHKGDSNFKGNDIEEPSDTNAQSSNKCSQDTFASMDSFDKMILEENFDTCVSGCERKQSQKPDDQIVPAKEFVILDDRNAEEADKISENMADDDNEIITGITGSSGTSQEIDCVEIETPIFVHDENDADNVMEQYSLEDKNKKSLVIQELCKNVEENTETISCEMKQSNFDISEVDKVESDGTPRDMNGISGFDKEEGSQDYKGEEDVNQVLSEENEPSAQSELPTLKTINSPSNCFNTSLDISLSLDDNIPLFKKNGNIPSKGEQPTLRIGWKPPLKPTNVVEVSQEETTVSNDKPSNKVKPTFRCLQLLQKARSERKENLLENPASSKSSFQSNPARHNGHTDSDNVVNMLDRTGKRSVTKHERNSVPLHTSKTKEGTNKRPGSQVISWTPQLPAVHPCNTPGALTDQQYKTVGSVELEFPGRGEVEGGLQVQRQAAIPPTFPSVQVYRQILMNTITEYLNTQLFEVARRFHHALSKLDTSGYSKSEHKSSAVGLSIGNPACQCGVPSKLVMVKKAGSNQGRHFYSCSAGRQQQCKWADESRKGGGGGGVDSKQRINSVEALNLHMKNLRIHFYGECTLIKRAKEKIKKFFKPPKWVRSRESDEACQTKQMYLKLPYKAHSSQYAKDDLWVISQQLDFPRGTCFLARSMWYGPSSSMEVEIEPVVGYSPSNWQNGVVCHAILAGNASSELSCLDNLRDHVLPNSPPIMTQLIHRRSEDILSPKLATSTGFHAPLLEALSSEYIEKYHLNVDQAEAMRRVAAMFTRGKSDNVDSVLLIHGVFGAGKSFLLSVVILFLMEVFSQSPQQQLPWKLLISSTTNVAVDRILMGVHAGGTASQELKDLQEMLRSGDLTNQEKSHVRQSIEKHRHGENKKKLGRVHVVGATCASCSLNCLNNMTFPGSIPTLLRTQYRCHPNISAVANTQFYGGMLQDGVSQHCRKPLLEVLPTLCYYDVSRGSECCEGAGSFYNEAESQYVAFLLQLILGAGLEPGQVGVITLYRAQVARITDILASCADDVRGVLVSTVDAFQGGERDVIILSTVRTNATGFIDNDKRTNVALTRARHHLLIVGHHGNLSANPLWSRVIHHCRGYPDGFQCADEARAILEQYLETLKDSPRTSQASHATGDSQTSLGSGKGSNSSRRKSAAKSASSTRESTQDGVQNGGRRRKGRKRKSHASSVLHNDSDSEDFCDSYGNSRKENIENQGSGGQGNGSQGSEGQGSGGVNFSLSSSEKNFETAQKKCLDEIGDVVLEASANSEKNTQ